MDTLSNSNVKKFVELLTSKEFEEVAKTAPELDYIVYHYCASFMFLIDSINHKEHWFKKNKGADFDCMFVALLKSVTTMLQKSYEDVFFDTRACEKDIFIKLQKLAKGLKQGLIELVCDCVREHRGIEEKKEIELLEEKFWSLQQHNRGGFWLASKFMCLLGYDRFEYFLNEVVSKALSTCIAISANPANHFDWVVEDDVLVDIKLSLYGCSLCTSRADPHNPAVQRMAFVLKDIGSL